ncbi:MAG TPA: hypothetical protein VLL95_00790 [Phnomibacter sp.]|nr:hypothetical protein [Phnomibacter sp.]
MKKFLIVLSLVFIGYASQAQELGIRLGNVTGGSAAVDGLFSLGKFSRVHANVSFGSGLGIEALWDFLYKPLDNEAFHWYVGAGPSLLIDDPFKLGVAGEIGLGYYFKGVPISLSADWRPTFVLVEKTSMDWGGFGVNVRYVFNKK